MDIFPHTPNVVPNEYIFSTFDQSFVYSNAFEIFDQLMC